MGPGHLLFFSSSGELQERKRSIHIGLGKSGSITILIWIVAEKLCRGRRSWKMTRDDLRHSKR